MWDHSFSRTNQHNSRILCDSYTARYAFPIYMLWFKVFFGLKFFTSVFVCVKGRDGVFSFFFGGGGVNSFQNCIIFGMLPKQ